MILYNIKLTVLGFSFSLKTFVILFLLNNIGSLRDVLTVVYRVVFGVSGLSLHTI